MDSNSKTSAPETMSYQPGSSVFSPLYDSSSSSSSHSSNYNNNNNTEHSVNNFELEGESRIKINGTGVGSDDGGSSVSSDGESENGEFVSGDEDFETASERPVLAAEETLEITAEEEFTDAPDSVLSFQKAQENGDDEDDGVGDSEVRNSEELGLKIEPVVGDKGLKVILDEDFVKQLENDGLSSGGKEGRLREDTNSGEFLDENHNDVQEGKIEVLDGEKFVETKDDSGLIVFGAGGVNLTGGGDAVVEAVDVDVLKPGVAVVGDLEGIKINEIKGLVSDEGGNVSLENGFDKINPVSEVVESDSVETNKDNWEIEFGEEAGNIMGNGDIVVDALKVDVLKSGVAIVGDLEGTRDIGLKGLEIPNEGNMSLENRFDKINIVNEVVESSSVPVETMSEKNFESSTNDDVVTAEDNPKEHIDLDGAADVVEIASHDMVDEVGENETEADKSMQSKSAPEDEQIENDQTVLSTHSEKLEDEDSDISHTPEPAELSKISDAAVTLDAEEEGSINQDEEDEIEGAASDGETDGMIFGSSEAAKQFLEELERASGVGSHSSAESSRHSQRIDGQIVTDSDEEVDTDEEGEGKELFDSVALAALLKAAAGADSDGGNITVTSQDGSKLFSVERPAGLGTSLRTLRPAPRPNRTSLFTPFSLTPGGETETDLTAEEKAKLEKLQQLRVKFLRLVHRLGQSPEESIAGQVLYRLALVSGRKTGQLFSLDAAKRTALQLEAEGKDDLNFTLNILVLGKTGVGKSATINSIFGEEKTSIHAFEPGTTAVKEIVGTVDGVKIRVIDTPGLKSSGVEQGANRKVLASIKKFTKKCSPDIVLYLDRLDSQTRDLNDLPLLKSITTALGTSIWRTAIVTLTHAASAPPDGPAGSPLSYEVFVAQRSHVVQQSIGQAVGDLRLMNPSLMNPVSLVDNHSACPKNRDGQKVLPNGQTWRPQLLLLCYSMKILSETSSLSKPQESFDNRKLFGFRGRSAPLPYLLSWLLQSRTHPKLSTDQGDDNGDSDVDLADFSDSDQEVEEDEYDQLPPFKPLRKAQIAKLSKEQQKAYFEEYDYRVKLLQKKQWREELRRMREMKKKKGNATTENYSYAGEDVDQENESPAAVPVPLPDMVLPPSFDCDTPAYRYRFLEPNSQFLARPVLDTHGWDHDCGYDGVNLEHSLEIASRFPVAVTAQVTKDKKEFNLHLDSSIAAKLGENGSSMAGFDIQNVGKQLAYVLRGETKFKNFRRNKTAAGVSVTFLGEHVATGLKLEDQIALGKRLMLVGSTGTVRSQGDSAYGANLEVRLKEADFPIGQDQSSLGLSLVKWRGDLALGANLQSQFSVGRGSKIAVRAGLNNKLSGQITVRTSTSDQLQIALLAILPVAMTIYKNIRPGAEASESYSMY